MSSKNNYHTDHNFINGYCGKCGWSRKWAEIKGWDCPVSDNENHYDNSSEEKSNEINFFNHKFENGYCKKCGWSYSWARKKNEKCPISHGKNKSDSSKREYESKQQNYSQNSKKESNFDSKPRDEGAKYGKILSLSGKVTIKDIKKNYRELSKKYHPDRVNNLGDEFKVIADKKMKELNEAYAWFKRKYDF